MPYTDDLKPQRMHGRSQQVFDALREAGIIHEGDYVRRVIIDIDVMQAVRIYVERYADTRVLEILPVIGHGRSEIIWSDSPATVAEAEQV